MEIVIGAVWIALFASNIVFLVLWLKAKHKLSKPRSESVELHEFLVDLMGGTGLVKVSRIAPGDMLIRARARTMDQ